LFGYIYPLDNFCIFSEKPLIIKMKNGLLHSENGPSVEYADGFFKVWSLNGVGVPQYLVETKWNELDCTVFLKEPNAEVRREFVRKAGIEKVCKDLNAKVISKGFDQAGQPCELLLLDLKDGRERPYIKLLNPSMGIYHIEGVPTECKTLEQAFNSRKPIVMKDIPVAKDGEDWYQQGDVCVWPKNAKSLKPNPKILT
jgi:hypothetical protein